MSDSFESAADTAIEHAAADAAAGLARGRGTGADTHCRNCGAALEGDFCHVCGQSAQSVRRPFWALLAESLETLFAVDGRLARTVPDLLLRPGRMTRAYLDGQRMRFIPPFRLYVVASLLFFVLLPLVTGQGLSVVPGGAQNFDEAREQIETAYADGDMTDAEYQEAIAGLTEVERLWRSGPTNLLTPDAPTPPGETDAPAAGDESEWAGFMPEEALDAVRAAGAEGDPEAARFAEVMDNPGQLAEQTQEWIPRMMFVLLPVYACLLGLVYLWRRQFLFYDHLIVSLHFHSALFFSMAIGMLAAYVVGVGWVTLAIIVYSNWYLYRLNRTVYGRGRFSSVLRVLTLDSIYFCILMSALLTAVILGALSL
ncbi:putative membrane protein [Hyphomonas neptunium ATCC 15444]|uniref:DUF3667 domain-containing protein n=2 Tax=Hyphomonas TaxID=85 RepID=A0A059FN78_9PROT|nr:MULTISPECIES: DUF3667 domain-containing protein [Hyphomonas]ABI78150.1 putative membrane protein [Hyphomonas neptunium ATCC 15444]KCZ92047.1 hypothetical protein HHI_12479 [Hyphomonas hirschiana VP5]